MYSRGFYSDNRHKSREKGFDNRKTNTHVYSRWGISVLRTCLAAFISIQYSTIEEINVWKLSPHLSRSLLATHTVMLNRTEFPHGQVLQTSLGLHRERCSTSSLSCDQLWRSTWCRGPCFKLFLGVCYVLALHSILRSLSVERLSDIDLRNPKFCATSNYEWERTCIYTLITSFLDFVLQEGCSGSADTSTSRRRVENWSICSFTSADFWECWLLSKILTRSIHQQHATNVSRPPKSRVGAKSGTIYSLEAALTLPSPLDGEQAASRACGRHELFLQFRDAFASSVFVRLLLASSTTIAFQRRWCFGNN